MSLDDYSGRQYDRVSIEDQYDELLDEVYEPFKMGELTFLPSDILKSCDPVAYRCYLVDYKSTLEEEEDEPEEDDEDTYTRDADWEAEGV